MLTTHNFRSQSNPTYMCVFAQSYACMPDKFYVVLKKF